MISFKRYYEKLMSEEDLLAAASPVPATPVTPPVDPNAPPGTPAPSAETPVTSAETKDAFKDEKEDMEKITKIRNEMVKEFNAEQTDKTGLSLVNFEKDKDIGFKIVVSDPYLKKMEKDIIKGLVKDEVFKNDLMATARESNAYVVLKSDGGVPYMAVKIEQVIK